MMCANPFDRLPRRVRLRDMTLRDGLQSVAAIVPTTEKMRIFEGLIEAGITELQVTSFVNPARVPQMADAAEIWAMVEERPVRKSVLVANRRGFERAAASGCPEIEAVVSVSDAYNQKNAHRSTAESIAEIGDMAAGRGSDRRLTIGLANSFHCVTEGRIDPDRVMAVVAELAGFGIVDISLCDTTGHATPDHVFELCGRAIDAFPLVTFGAHLHDTRGRGIVNAVAALSAGIEWFDATLAGLGGSPFSPGAGGNLSLEAFAETLEAMGVETGIDVDRISRTGAEIGSHLGLGGARPV